MPDNSAFFDLYTQDYLRVAVAIPCVALAQPPENARRTLALMQQAEEQGVALVVFPELGLTGYSCDDLFHQSALLDTARQALSDLIEASRALSVLAVVGLPWRHRGHLYNVAALIGKGMIHGLVPKSYLPNYREFYEARQFTAALTSATEWIDWAGTRVPFGPRLLFQLGAQPLATLAIEICEDLWVPIPPSSLAALAGATLLLNPSASNASLGKADYRRQLVSNQSARCLAAYLYSAAGAGESTTDLAWDGHGLIADYGQIIRESERYQTTGQLLLADIDLARLEQERLRQNTFAQACQLHGAETATFERVRVEWSLPSPSLRPLLTAPSRYPYVPMSHTARLERCAEVFQIQVQGLRTRLQSTGLKSLVVGISGGLDSTLALLVACAVVDQLGWSRAAVRAYTLPGFATGQTTRNLALALMTALGVQAEEIDIRPSCQQMLHDIQHPYAQGEPCYDITFENVQAGERTSHLFRLANQHGALVVGTSDLSELALGWSTYGVGDHMAHYHVNAGVPKTLVQHLLHWAQTLPWLAPEVAPLLETVLNQEISPELVPDHGQGLQRSEATVGPYPLQDFFLYHTLRFGFSPKRLAFMAWCVWRSHPDEAEPGYSFATLRHWLGIFMRRFFQNSQFKRSCLANSPKIGSGGSLSPRGDWRAPSDGVAQIWLDDVDRLPLNSPGDH